MQPQGHLQVLQALIDDDLEPQAALDRPRVCILGGNPEGKVALEEGIPKRTLTNLAKLGHLIEHVQGFDRAIFGRGQSDHSARSRK